MLEMCKLRSRNYSTVKNSIGLDIHSTQFQSTSSLFFDFHLINNEMSNVLTSDLNFPFYIQSWTLTTCRLSSLIWLTTCVLEKKRSREVILSDKMITHEKPNDWSFITRTEEKNNNNKTLQLNLSNCVISYALMFLVLSFNKTISLV